MLCLSRRKNDKITIEVPHGAGGTIEITVVDIMRWKTSGRPQCRLGIEAPREFAILRAEAKAREPQ